MQRCLFNLHRRLLPIDVIRSKAQEYVDAALVDQQSAHAMVRVIELERGGESVFIERHGVETEGEGGGAAGEGDQIATKLNMRQLAELLADRERLMRQGSEAGQPTDQWRVFLMAVPFQCEHTKQNTYRRVYSEIVEAFQSQRRLRMMVQASAGTGHIFVVCVRADCQTKQQQRKIVFTDDSVPLVRRQWSPLQSRSTHGNCFAP